MSLDPLGVGAFNPGNGGGAGAGAGAGVSTTPPVMGMTMGPPALSIPHATADPGTKTSITSSSAITIVPTSSTTPESSTSTTTDTNTNSTTKMVSQDGGRTMPVYTDVRTTWTPRVDSYGAAAAIKPAEISNA